MANLLQAPGNSKQLSIFSNQSGNSGSGTVINVPEDLQIQKINSGRVSRQEEQPGSEINSPDDTGESKDVFSRLANPLGGARRLRREASPNRTIDLGRQSLGGSQWQLVHDKHDSHRSAVYAMTSVENQLYSAAARSLRIWDIGTMRLLSDISDKIGVIKSIALWKERNLLMTAAEKNIMMWDVVSLTNVGVLKGFKEEIKALNFVPEK